MNESVPTLLLALASGVGIAAASGLRAFLPLFAVGIAARLGWIELQQGTTWLAATPTLVALGVATLLEILGDKIPAVDHALDLVSTITRPLAAWLGAYAVMTGWPAPWGSIVTLLLGGGALGFHLLKAKLRLGSTVTTMGHGNPLLSILEDTTVVALLILALLAPLLVILLVVLLAWVLIRTRRMRALARTPP
jgi:hypothetical protein